MVSVIGADQNRWYIDSACTSHMTGNLKLLRNVVPLDEDHLIQIADKRIIRATHCGSTILGMRGTKIKLDNVLYAPELGANLFSVRQAVARDGYSILFHNKNDCVLQTNGNERIELESEGDMWSLFSISHSHSHSHSQNSPTTHTACLSVACTDSIRWHRRMGHVGLEAIKSMIKKNAVIGLDLNAENIKRDLCEICVKCKTHRSSFASDKPILPTAPLECIHSDICGKIQVGEGNVQYFITFVDGFTGFVCVYAMKSRDGEPLQCLDNFVKQMKIACPSHTIKRLHCDNGGEYTAMSNYCLEHSIKLTHSPPDCPQMNGIAERVNRTLCNLVRCLLSDAKLLRYYWPQALNVAVYIKNRVLTKAVTNAASDKTPYERLYGLKPDISNLRVFGCVCFVNVKTRTKLEDTYERVILVGYSDNDHSYEIMRMNRKIVNRRCEDVICFEDKTQNDDFDPALPLVIGDQRFTEPEPVSFELPDDSPSSADPAPPSLQSVSSAPMVDPNDPNPFDYSVIVDDLDEEMPQAPKSSTASAAQTQNCHLAQSKTHYQASSIRPEVASHSRQASTVRPAAVDKQKLKLDRCMYTFIQPNESGKRVELKDAPKIGSAVLQNEKFVHSSSHIDNQTSTHPDALTVQLHSDDVKIPNNMHDVIASPERDRWIAAINVELDSFKSNEVFVPVKPSELPKSQHVIGSRFVFAVKTDEHGHVTRFKARLVARGFTQIENVDYHLTYSPVLAMRSLRILLAYAAIKNLPLRHVDVITAFLNGKLPEELYMSPPDGWNTMSNDIWRLQRAVYGLKQAGRMWYIELKKFFAELNFERSSLDECVFTKTSLDDRVIMVGVFVDEHDYCV